MPVSVALRAERLVGYGEPGSAAWWNRLHRDQVAAEEVAPMPAAPRQLVLEPMKVRPACSGRVGFPGSDPSRSSRPRAYQRRFSGRPSFERSFETMAFWGPPTHNRRAQTSFYRRVSMSQIPPPPPGQPTPMGGAGAAGRSTKTNVILAYLLWWVT